MRHADRVCGQSLGEGSAGLRAGRYRQMRGQQCPHQSKTLRVGSENQFATVSDSAATLRVPNWEVDTTVSDAGSVALIVEPRPAGHRLYYVGLLVDEVRSRGARPVLFTTEAVVESDEWKIHLEGTEPEVLLSDLDDLTLPDIVRASHDVEADLTIVPEADQYLRSVLVKGWTGAGVLKMLIMRADGQPGPPLPKMRILKGLAKKALVIGADLRRRVEVFALRSPITPRRGPLRWVQEPVTLRCSSEEIAAAKERLDRHGDRYWFGVVGSITPRKNLPLIVESMLGEGESGVGLLVAGHVLPEVSEVVDPLLEQFVAAGGRVVRMDGHLSDAEFDAAIGAVDCIVAAHSNEGPSAVVLKAAASGKRLVLAGAKSLREDANHLGDQAVWSRLDQAALRDALREVRCLTAPVKPVSAGTYDFRKKLT